MPLSLPIHFGCAIFLEYKSPCSNNTAKSVSLSYFIKQIYFLFVKDDIYLSIPYVYCSYTTYNGLRGHEKYNYYIFHLFLLFCYSRQQMKESVSMGQIDTTKGMYLYVVSTTTFLSS